MNKLIIAGLLIGIVFPPVGIITLFVALFDWLSGGPDIAGERRRREYEDLRRKSRNGKRRTR